MKKYKLPPRKVLDTYIKNNIDNFSDAAELSEDIVDAFIDDYVYTDDNDTINQFSTNIYDYVYDYLEKRKINYDDLLPIGESAKKINSIEQKLRKVIQTEIKKIISESEFDMENFMKLSPYAKSVELEKIINWPTVKFYDYEKVGSALQLYFLDDNNNSDMLRLGGIRIKFKTGNPDDFMEFPGLHTEIKEKDLNGEILPTLIVTINMK